MAQGLLGGVLPAIYSGADQLKRGVYGLLTNPQEQAQRAAQSLLQSRAERQALMGQAFANPDRPFQVTNQAALGQLGSDVLTGELGIAPIGMIAYHGTPHNIVGKFDMSKVGTGEGNQSYGHGMYFAEARPVAEQYQASLAETKYLSGGKELKGNDAWAASFLHDFQGNALPKKVDVNTAVAKANEILKSGEAREEIVSKIKQLDKAGVSVENGNLYKVDIPDKDIPMMLDYDNPIKNQPEILNKIRGLIKDPDILKSFDHNVEKGMTGANVYTNWIPTGINKQALYKERDDLLNKYLTDNMGYSDAVKSMTPDDYAKFQNVAKQIDDLKNKPKIVSEILNDVGIKGIRYLDQGSRGKGGTSNYVVFDPTEVKILERNDKPLEGLLD